jgi:hypothetical protein
MSIREIAEAFAQLCKDGRHEEAGERFWADSVVSREAMEGPMAADSDGSRPLIPI